jgi:DNA helicase-2/ATP-dependent DNA helicase PcrA
MSLSLTTEQQSVVDHQLPGHGRVLAGPGVGKSTTAAALAENLLSRGEPHPKVRFVTFTRAATKELAKKLSEDNSVTLEPPSTIHSFAISTLLRNSGCASFPSPLRIPDKFEYRNLIRPHLARMTGVGLIKFDKLVEEMAANWESLVPDQKPGVTPEERARFVGAWTEHRRLFGYTLLDELPDLMRCALRDHEDLKGIDYNLLIIDEYQDLNACELEILRRLAKLGVSVLAIGDDDQSIYSFRKAHPAGIRRFLEDFATDHDYKLTICHRSPRQILGWASHVIEGDTEREQRNPPTLPETAPEGVAALLAFRGEVSEARGVADLIMWLKNTRRIPFSKILVLSRTDRAGTFTKPIKDELKSRNVPVSDPSAVQSLLAENSNRRLLATLRLLANANDSLAWWTLTSTQGRLGEKFVAHISELAKARHSTWGETFVAEARTSFLNAPSIARTPAANLWQEMSAFIEHTELPVDTDGFDWGNWIVERVNGNQLPSCTDELKQLLIQVDGATEKKNDLGLFLSQVEPIGKDLAMAHSEGVRFMTMVGSKGLTVEATIIVGVENDLIPRPDQDLSEERRLLYVAMTRPRECLFLTWAAKRKGPAARSGRANVGRRQPSEFLRGGPLESQDGVSYIASLST